MGVEWSGDRGSGLSDEMAVTIACIIFGLIGMAMGLGQGYWFWHDDPTELRVTPHFVSQDITVTVAGVEYACHAEGGVEIVLSGCEVEVEDG